MPLSEIELELIELLRKVRRLPGAYLGGVSLDRLSGFISGFLHSRLTPDDADPAIIWRFRDWLRQQTGIDKDGGWEQFIRFYASDDQTAFESFFQHFEAFLSDMKQAQQGACDGPPI